MDLEGKAALITGGGVGTGRAVALALAARGCNVAVNYAHSQAEAAATAHDAEKLGVTAVAVKGDVRDDDAVRSMTAQSISALGGLDVLVNNAGITRFIDHDDLESVTDEAWDLIFDTNARGTLRCTRAALPALQDGDGGAVVNVSSIAGVYGIGSSIPYCASKAAVNNMTVTMARALAPKVRVNAVAPGFIDTRWWQENEHYEVIKELATAATPLQNVCQPEDVADVVLGLIGADLVTGQIVVVDGGVGIAQGLAKK